MKKRVYGNDRKNSPWDFKKCPVLLCFPLLNEEDYMIYSCLNIRCNRQKFLSFWAIFCPFSLLTTQKIKILKLKKTPGDFIILQICTINDNYMIYGSWDMKHDRQKFLSFWTIFCPFTPLRTQKIKLLRKWKNTWSYYHFTNVYHKW